MLKLSDELIVKYDNLVYSIVNKYSSNYNKEDLLQVGRNALVIAYQKYDPNLNIKFSTYSYKYILGEILKYIREDKNIHISRDLITLNKKIKDLNDQYQMINGTKLSSKELSSILKIDESKINEVINLYQNTESLDSTEYDEEGLPLYDKISNQENIDQIDLISLKDALNTLNDEDKNLIYQRYYENKTQTELANEMNISQVKVYRMERKILDDLKTKMY